MANRDFTLSSHPRVLTSHISQAAIHRRDTITSIVVVLMKLHKSIGSILSVHLLRDVNRDFNPQGG